MDNDYEVIEILPGEDRDYDVIEIYLDEDDVNEVIDVPVVNNKERHEFDLVPKDFSCKMVEINIENPNLNIPETSFMPLIQNAPTDELQSKKLSFSLPKCYVKLHNIIDVHAILKCNKCIGSNSNDTKSDRPMKKFKNPLFKSEPVQNICGKNIEQKPNLKVLKFKNKVKEEIEKNPNMVMRLYFRNQCPQAFKHKSDLKKHKTVHEKKFHACTVCDKIFKWKMTLKKHLRLHENAILTYKCKDCGESFSQKADFITHVKITHTGKLPFVCDECGKNFKLIKYLKRHYLVHTKPYICHVCGKNFSFKSELAKHEGTHSGLWPYTCRACGKGFLSISHFKYHMVSKSGCPGHVKGKEI